MKLWDDFSLEEGLTFRWRVGKLELYVKVRGNDLYIGHSYSEQTSETEVAVESSDPDKLKWLRFILPDNKRTIRLRPALPDRPVIAEAGETIRILSKQKAHFFIPIPFWLRLYLVGGKEQLFYEVPTLKLSNTWFGPPESGALCYASAVNFYNDLQSALSEESAVVPLSINNNSNSFFDLKKAAVYGNFLNIYRGEKILITNVENVNYFSEERVTFELGSKKPLVEEELELFIKAREQFSSSIIKKSVYLLKSFSNF